MQTPGPGLTLGGELLSVILYVTQLCFRAGNRPSGPDFGRTATGKAPKLILRPAFGRPETPCRCFPNSSPATNRPVRPIYGPEALLRNIEYLLYVIGFVRCPQNIKRRRSSLRIGLSGFCADFQTGSGPLGSRGLPWAPEKNRQSS